MGSVYMDGPNPPGGWSSNNPEHRTVAEREAARHGRQKIGGIDVLVDSGTYRGWIDREYNTMLILCPFTLHDYMRAKTALAAAPDLLRERDDLRAALEAAVERMEAVAEGIPVHKRHKGVSPATHVAHMAGHLAEHAKIARKALYGGA